MERDYLRICPFEALTFQLIKCFKKQAAVALQAITTSRFTLADIQARKTLQAFTQEMVHNAKAAEMTSTYNQLLSMWNRLNILIQTQIPMPEASMTFQQFFRVVDQREPILYNMAH